MLPQLGLECGLQTAVLSLTEGLTFHPFAFEFPALYSRDDSPWICSTTC